MEQEEHKQPRRMTFKAAMLKLMENDAIIQEFLLRKGMDKPWEIN